MDRSRTEYKREIAWGSIFAGAAVAIPILGGGASLYLGVLNELADYRRDIDIVSEKLTSSLYRLERVESTSIQLHEVLRQCRETQILLKSKLDLD